MNKIELMPHQLDIPGYEGLYTVDSDGIVYSCITTQSRRKGVIKPHVKNGYLSVNLFKDGKAKHHYVHRLVAQAYISNPFNYKYINHIDCDKQNNCVSNLEWCSQKQNIEHSIQNGLQHKRFKTVVDGVAYETMKQASVACFGDTWQIKMLRYKHGDNFTFNGKHVEIESEVFNG